MPCDWGRSRFLKRAERMETQPPSGPPFYFRYSFAWTASRNAHLNCATSSPQQQPQKPMTRENPVDGF